jgi:NAD(P)-dependent dehydrogenase (short-subunit alcohol dehydrogenase family)
VSLDNEAQVTAFYANLPELAASVHLVGGFAMSPIDQTSLAEFENQWRINTVTCFLACREAVKAFRRGKTPGRIVNVAARPAVSPVGGMIAYSTAKAANRKAMPTADHASWPKPAEIAQTIAFLASPDNALTSGALVAVYGRA